MDKIKNIFNYIKKSKFLKLDFIRGLGLVVDKFELLLQENNKKILIEISTGLRIKTFNKILLSYSDLYLDKKHKLIEPKNFRKQIDIEKTLLCLELENINTILKNAKVQNFKINLLGDLTIYFSNGIIIECFNDVTLFSMDSSLYNIILKQNENILLYNIFFDKNSLIYKKNNFDFNTISYDILKQSDL